MNAVATIVGEGMSTDYITRVCIRRVSVYGMEQWQVVVSGTVMHVYMSRSEAARKAVSIAMRLRGE